MQWLAIVVIEDKGDEDGTPHALDYIRDYVESMDGDGKIKLASYRLIRVDPVTQIFEGTR